MLQTIFTEWLYLTSNIITIYSLWGGLFINAHLFVSAVLTFFAHNFLLYYLFGAFFVRLALKAARVVLLRFMFIAISTA